MHVLGLSNRVWVNFSRFFFSSYQLICRTFSFCFRIENIKIHEVFVYFFYWFICMTYFYKKFTRTQYHSNVLSFIPVLLLFLLNFLTVTKNKYVCVNFIHFVVHERIVSKLNSDKINVRPFIPYWMEINANAYVYFVD